MKALNIVGTVVTSKTAAGFIMRMARLSDRDLSGALVLDEIESKVVEAGFLTWEQVEAFEAKAWNG